MKKQKTIIFDMDGVIIDSVGYWERAEYEVFSSLGVEITSEGSGITKSMTTSEVTNFWYNKSPWSDIDLTSVEQMVISRVIELIDTGNCQINGVKSFIETLKINNYKIGLATNSPYRIIPVVLNKLGIVHLFDTFISAEFEEKGKPDPAVYYTAAKSLEAKPEDCIVIEDSNTGMLAAKNAGMTVIAYTNGNNNVNYKIADYKLNSFDYAEFEMMKMK